MNGADQEEERSKPGALLKRVPGRIRTRKQSLKAFEENAAALRRRYKRELWFFLIPEPTDLYRWKMQLECGCVREVFTTGKDVFPDARRWTGYTAEEALPLGEYWCPNEHGEIEPVYRDVVEWIDRRVTHFPADPVECPDDMPTDVWVVLRQPEPHSAAFWRVRLSCGHIFEHVVTGVEWKPEDGPKMITEHRAAEMRSGLEKRWSAKDHVGWPKAGAERDHVRKMLDLCWPRPEPEQNCRACHYAQRITGYQRIGWLMPQPDQNDDLERTAEADRARVEARLKKIEAEARQLREQLGLDQE